MTDMWMNGDGAELTITVPAGVILAGTLEQVSLMARYAAGPARCGRSLSTGAPCPEHSSTGSELLRYSYQPAPDPDAPDAPPEPRRYARLVLEHLPAPEAGT